MPRDHRQLRVFHHSHGLTLDIYRHSKGFPKDEWYGLRAQMRRAAVSIPSNIVEGNARRTTAAYLNFLYIALGSGCELHYLVCLATDLELITKGVATRLMDQSDHVVRQLERLIETMEDKLSQERVDKNPDGRRSTMNGRRLRRA